MGRSRRDETHLAKVRRARLVDRILESTYPDARCELDFGNAFELLIATVLSAQTTDVRVNQVTPALFAHYPDAAALAAAPLDQVEELIHSTGFFRAKARNIVGLAAMIERDFAGQVPRTMEQLTRLPGVGRKTANVVLGNAFGVPGFPVDTHVGRLARRLDFTVSDDPVQIEAELCALIARERWTDASHRLIFHGRRICFARNPQCGRCPIAQLCPAALT